MIKADITVHMVVKNEDIFIWHSITSVLPFIDKLLITDTGSTDETLKILSSIRSEKIEIDRIKSNIKSNIGSIRQQQLTKTQTDWIWILDGDEIYPDSLGNEIMRIIQSKGSDLEGIVVGRYDLLGDIYHFQSDGAGIYDLFGQKGHFALRLINKKNIQGLHIEGNYPYEGYYDKDGIELINHNRDKYIFTDGKLWHAMYLQRSTSGKNLSDTLHRNKYKIETGLPIPDTSSLPKVFSMFNPNAIKKITQERSIFYEMIATIITPLKKLKRNIWHLLK